MNFVRARLTGSVVEFATYRFELPQQARDRLPGVEGEVLLGLRPEHFFDPRVAAPGSAGNRLPVTVELTEELGSETLIYFRADGIEAEQASEGEVELGGALVARLDPRTHALPGEQLDLGIDMERAHFFDAVTGNALSL
jgi:multiple sugar transport system ATP-binding protein